jgi:hypothetical protein
VETNVVLVLWRNSDYELLGRVDVKQLGLGFRASVRGIVALSTPTLRKKSSKRSKDLKEK